MSRAAVLAMIVVVVCGCHPEADEPQGPAAPSATVIEGTLVRLEGGQGTCRVVLAIAGVEQSLVGDVDLCQSAQALIGKVVVGMQNKDLVMSLAAK